MAIYRYPGGKTRIANSIAKFFSKSKKYAEVFVGGGSVFAACLRNASIKEFRINDKDIGVSSFWSCLVSCKNRNTLFKKILSYNHVKLADFYRIKECEKSDLVSLAFKSIFLNRTSFSGLGVNPIGGKNQTSKWKVGCRYNAKKLIHECGPITRMMDKTEVAVSFLDFKEFLESLPNSFDIYLDPPYFKQGENLYQHYFTINDHVDLSSILKSRQGKWLLSYDDAPEIRELYSWASVVAIDMRYSINGKKANWSSKKELIITPKEFRNEAQACFSKRPSEWERIFFLSQK